jgi:hypothetical protein
MDAMQSTIETVFAEIIILTLQTVISLPSDRFILLCTLITKILLSKWFIDLAAMGLANFISIGNCLCGGEGKDVRCFFTRIIRA